MNRVSAQPVRRIAILGDGFAAWLAATWLAQQLNTKKTEITVIGNSVDEATELSFAALPSTPDDLLGAIGISALDLLIQHDGAYSLGLDIEGQVVPCGAVGRAFQGAAFHHHWRLANSPQSYFQYSPSYVALQDNRFAPPLPRNAIGGLQHEVIRHADPLSLTAALRPIARQRGVQWVAHDAHGLNCDASHIISSIRCDDGTTVACDWVIDASGVSRLAGADDWLTSGDARSLSATRDVPEQPLRPCITIHSDAASWQTRIPLWQQTITVHSRIADSDTTPTPGYRQTPWIGNCVSLGASAYRSKVVLPWQSLLLMRSIRRLLEFLPDARHMQAVRRAYNRQTSAEHAELAGFERLLECRALPDNKRASALGATLARRVALWRRRGHWVNGDDTLLDHVHWTNALMAFGVEPDQHDPIAERLAAAERDTKMAELATKITQIVREFPPLSRYIEAAHRAVAEQRAGRSA